MNSWWPSPLPAAKYAPPAGHQAGAFLVSAHARLGRGVTQGTRGLAHSHHFTNARKRASIEPYANFELQ